MNKTLFSILFLLSLTLIGYSQVQETTNTATKTITNSAGNNRLFSISGLAVAKTEKTLLSKATIKFQKYTTNPVELINNQIQTIKTDENGRWLFKNLPAGEYKIIVAPPDYSGKDKTTERNNQQKLATVTKIIKITGEDIRDLVIELPVESTISGSITVKGDNQNPDFTYIIATDEKQGIVSGSPVNGKNFRIENLSAGSFFLNLSADEDYYVQSIKLGNEDITNSTINLKDGENVKNVQITMINDVGTVKGKVIGFEPDKGTLIVLLPFKYTAQNSLRSSMPEVPDENGEFEIKAPPGEYFVAIVTQENMAARDKDNLEAWFKEITKNAQKVVISSNQTTGVELKMKN